jgi:hypothetical protein
MDKLRLCTGENPDKTGVGGECAKKASVLLVPYHIGKWISTPV